jgi:hypothetical protein
VPKMLFRPRPYRIGTFWPLNLIVRLGCRSPLCFIRTRPFKKYSTNSPTYSYNRRKIQQMRSLPLQFRGKRSDYFPCSYSDKPGPWRRDYVLSGHYFQVFPRRYRSEQ